MPPNVFQRVLELGPGDPQIAGSAAVRKLCGHAHNTREDAEACPSAVGLVLEREDTIDGRDVEVHRLRKLDANG